MFHQMYRLSLRFPLKILYVLVLQLVLTHSCRGQSQLIGSSQPIAATVGDDIILPCQLEPAEDVSARTVEWTRADLDLLNVHVHRAGQDVTHVKHPSYKGRTSLSIDELKQGNISLKLSMVKLSDGGKYRCFIPQLNKESFVELVVGAVSPPFISLAGIDRERGGVVLQCESKGWHPQPEVIWLDGEGNLLSAGPTETVSGPDGLYTVSSRVTVENKHSNNFTCRVQQNNINQIRETYIFVPDDFFKVQSSSSPVIIGLTVSLVVCIVFIVAVFFFVWKWRPNMIKTKRSCWDETEGGGNKNLSKSDDPEMQPLNVVDTDGETFIVTTAVSEEKKGKKEKKNKHLEETQADTDRKLQEEKQYREKAEREVKNQQKQIKNIQAECDLLMKLQQLHEDNQRIMRDLQTLKENLETKIKELETLKAAWFKGSKEKEAEKEKEVETLKKELQTKQDALETKTKEIKEIKDELQRLRDENQRKEIDNKEEDNSSARENVNSRPNIPPDENDDINTSSQRKTDAEDVKNLEEQENNERPDVSQHDNTKPAGQNSTEVFVNIDPNGKYLRLTTESKEDLKLGGWKLRVTLNDQNPIMFTFEESITLRAEKSVTIWVSGCGFHYPPSDLLWEDLKHWEKGDKLLVELIKCHEEIVTTTELEEKHEEDDQRKTDAEDVKTLEKEENNETQHNDINPSGKNSTDVFLEFDPDGNYLCVTNKSKEDLKLEGWKLRVKLNDKNPIMFTFEKSITLRAEKSVTIGVDDYGFHHPPSDLLWKDLHRWNKGDKLLVELINCHEEIVKTTETQGASKHKDTNPAGKNSTEVFVEIDPYGKYLRLTNKSKEDLKLEGWKLRVKLNDQNPIMYTFEESIKLRAEKKVTIWVPGFGFHSPPSNLTWKDLKHWTKGDKLLVELINCHEEIVTTTEV